MYMHYQPPVLITRLPCPFLTLSSSRLKVPYSLRVPLPLVRMPEPDIMMVPVRRLVIVAGIFSVSGQWVVMPASMEPDHLSTRRSIRILRKKNGR